MSTTPSSTPPDPEYNRASVERILESVHQSKGAESLNDADLADQVIDQVWSQLEVGSLEWAVLDELLHRFEERAGIERDDNGNVIVAGLSEGAGEDKPTGWKS